MLSGGRATGSSDGERICWEVGRRESAPQIAQWLHRLLPAIPATEHKTADLLVYDVHSRRLAEVGSVQRVPPDYDAPLGHLKWAPDNRRISFVYKNALYTVPVD